MAVNWGLAEPAAGPLDILRMAGQAQMEQLQQRQAQATFAQTQRVQAARPAIQQRLASGDYQGAQTAAIGAGDFDLAERVNSLSKQHLDQLDRETDTLGRVAFGLRNLPADQRAAAAQQAAPHLQELGIDPAQLDPSHLTDESLDGYITTATSLKDQIAQRLATMRQNEPTQTEKELIAAGVQPGTPEFREAMLGHVNPSQFMQVGSDATGHQVIQTRGMGAGTAPAGAPTGQQIEQAVSQIVPGAQVTSGARSPEHNREVGGVANSFHLTDQARDYVPPHGTSTAEFAATLKAKMPGFDVIDEGSHVHIEPSSRGAAPSGGPKVVYSTPAAPQEGYRTLTQQEATARGLPGGSVYQVGPKGQISSVSGTGNASSSRKAEAQLRQEFNQLPEVKQFRIVRTQGQTIKQLAKNPNAQNDIAMIFSYMKMLDPTSVVREGEFATAQNAAGVDDQVKNLYNKALSGERLNPQQRMKMVKSADTVYSTQRQIYNERAAEYRGYASDNEVNPDRVASRYVNKPKPQGRVIEVAPGITIQRVH